jgi:OOP family OmpA-OmpF porin
MKKQLAIALPIVAFCAAAAAQPYGVVSAGASRLSVDCDGVASCDKTDVGFKVMGGYRFTPNWAAELGYFDFGKAKADDGGISAEIGNTAVGLGLAFHQKLGADWNLVARLGAARVKTKLSGSVAGLGSASMTDKNTQAYAGLGLGYMLSKSTSIDLAWDYTRSQFKQDDMDESGSVHVLSVGLTFGF